MNQISIKEPLERLLTRVHPEDHPSLGHAYHLANASHEGQHRDAGQPYIIHPIAVSLILASEPGYSKDVEILTAALLHDAVEDSALSLEDISSNFGPKVTGLVDSVTKVDGASTRSRSARRAATLQRLFASAREDPRVLILKLADRVHNMRSIEGIGDPKRRTRIAKETLDVYCAVSHLLGMEKTRRELEDRSFACIDPDTHEELSRAIESQPDGSFCGFRDDLQQSLGSANIRARVRLHPRSLRSVFRRARRRREIPGGSVRDWFSIKVMVARRDSCYRALGVVHSAYPPSREGFHDFIALPKRNGYQALHTTVIDRGMRFEVQIQTPSMYRLGELGIATLHSDELEEAQRLRWLHELSEWHEHAGPADRFLDEVKRILFVEEIAVFTPEDDPIVLPREATVLDFAFAVHTDLGVHCSGARVNGAPATPFTALKWGDTVEILTDPDESPKMSWLRNVKTYRARRVIRRHLPKSE